MRIYFLLKDIFSLINIGLIIYLLRANSDRRRTNELKKISTHKILYAVLLLFLRILENRIDIHTMYVYLTVVVIFFVLGHIYEKYNIMYNFLVSVVFLSIVSLSQVISGTVGYILTKGTVGLYLLPINGQIGLMAVAEISIIVGAFLSTKIISGIPLKITRLNFITIMIPLIVNITIIALIGNKLYDSTDTFTASISTVVMMLLVCFVMIAGSICNIAVLEYYLNVKYIESEKKLRISEMSLQYDYYVRLEKDSDKIKRLAHDIRNHLEALKGSNNDIEKQEYIGSIESQLEGYESYYRTGNTFIDSLLQSKAREAAELDIELKAIVDLRPFKNVKNEDLCVMIANTVDNALRECSLKKKEEAEEGCIIQLRAGKIRNFLSIACENSIREEQAEKIRKEEELKTTKEDKQNHGYGIKNIESVVHRYGGEISISIKESMFCISMIIPV